MLNNLKYITILLILLFFNSRSAIAQQLVNPSFEGMSGIARIPEGWKAYGQASSPDTQPYAWSVSTPASHGNNYMSMVCRGFSIYDSYLWESCIQQLNNPLIVGNTYNYSIDLAYSTQFLADTISFSRPANLRIWGMSANMDKELLWESGAAATTNWQTFHFEIKPTIPTDFFILEAYYTELPKYCGNILMDNFKYYPQKYELQKDTLNNLINYNYLVDLNEYGLPEKIDGREVNAVGDLIFKGNKLTITVWDNRTTDGDMISLFMNDKNILKEFTISKDRLNMEVPIEEGKDYYLTLYAHNLGTIPPNTVALYISDGLRKKFLTLSSDLDKCEAVKIKIEHELAKAEY